MKLTTLRIDGDLATRFAQELLVRPMNVETKVTAVHRRNGAYEDLEIEICYESGNTESFSVNEKRRKGRRVVSDGSKS